MRRRRGGKGREREEECGGVMRVVWEKLAHFLIKVKATTPGWEVFFKAGGVRKAG